MHRYRVAGAVFLDILMISNFGYQQIELTKVYLPWKHAEEPKVVDAKVIWTIKFVIRYYTLYAFQEKTQRRDGMRNLLRLCPWSYANLLKYIASLRQRAKSNYDYFYKVHSFPHL